MNKILVILGPTATGKTDLAIKLAEKFYGELLSCDSRQVYRGLDIGTGKIPNSKFQISNTKKQNGLWEINGVKIWMYDVADLKKQYTVFNYVKDANKTIKDIIKRGKLPIIVGGSGLYLEALLYGLPNLAIPIDQNLRNKLINLTIKQLQQELQKLSPLRWGELNESDRQNPRRLVRAIELETSPRRSSFDYFDFAQYRYAQDHLRGVNTSFNALKIGLTAPREVLYKKADRKVMGRINQGMIEEVKDLQKMGLTLKRMRQLGLEYGVLADYLEGNINNKEDLIKRMKGKIHGLIRRQLSWFKKEKEVFWFNIATADYLDKIDKVVIDWYNQR